MTRLQGLYELLELILLGLKAREVFAGLPQTLLYLRSGLGKGQVEGALRLTVAREYGFQSRATVLNVKGSYE